MNTLMSCLRGGTFQGEGVEVAGHKGLLSHILATNNMLSSVSSSSNLLGLVYHNLSLTSTEMRKNIRDFQIHEWIFSRRRLLLICGRCVDICKQLYPFPTGPTISGSGMLPNHSSPLSPQLVSVPGAMLPSVLSINHFASSCVHIDPTELSYLRLWSLYSFCPTVSSHLVFLYTS